MSDKSHDPNQMTGAAMIVRALIDHGVKHIFGYPGGAVLPIYDELFQQDEVEHILVRHEQGAGHAAEGYARSTGKPGVALVTSGPGGRWWRRRTLHAAPSADPRSAAPASCAWCRAG